jgi:hypothetical protein
MSILTPIAPLTIYPELPYQNVKEFPTDPSTFKEQEEIMKSFTKWYQEQMPSFGLSGAGPSSSALETGKKETAAKKEEVKEVKMIVFNIFI